MAREPITIELAGIPYSIRPLTIGQLGQVEEVLNDGKLSAIKQAAAIVRIALDRHHAEAAAGFGEIEAGASEIVAAMGEVLKLAGFSSNESAPAA